MKSLQTILAALLLGSATTQGGLIAPGNSTLPVGTAACALSCALGDESALLNVSIGANGDSCACLNFKNGSVVRLDRIGKTGGDPVGSSTAGLGSGATDIQAYNLGSPVTDAYQPNRTAAEPQLVLDTSPQESSPVSFDSSGPKGFGSMAGEKDPSTLGSWGMEIQTVPEPVNASLGVFAGVVLVGMFASSQPVRRRARRCRRAFVHWVDAY